MSDDLWCPLLSVGAGLPSFKPPPQADLESFENDVEVLLAELDSFSVPIPTLPDVSFTTYRVPAPSLLSLSNSTYTTKSSEYPATSEYSQASLTYSTYSPSTSAFAMSTSALSMASIPSTDPSAFFEPFEPPRLSPAPFPHVYVDEDTGPYQPPVGVSPQSLSVASPTPPEMPTDSPVCATSMQQQARKLPDSDTGSIRKRFICPDCRHGSARKHNLKTHMEKHNPDRKKFVCPESDCDRSFTRKHCRKRHLKDKHGDQAK